MIDVSTFTVTAYDAENNAITKTVDVAAAGKTLKFQWGHVSKFSVSGLEAYVEPAEPVFTSAYVDSGSAGDCYIAFEGDSLGKMILNAYNLVTDNWEIMPETYKIGSASGDFYNAGFSHFTPVGGAKQDLDSGTVKVSIVDSKYCFEFVNVKTASTTINTTYVGTVTGLNLPDLRTALPKPTNVQVSVVGRTISVSWDAVDGADGYLFELYNPVEEKFTEIVEGTSFSFTGLKSLSKYYFKLSAYASDTNPNFKNSEEIYLEKTTEDTDPKIVLSKETISFTADGGDVAVDVTLKNIDGDFTYTVDVDWLTVTRSGAASLAVSAPAYDNESEDRSATITITAGDLTKGIAVTQSKKSSASTGVADGTESNPYVYACAVEYQSLFGGYYTLTFTCKTEGSFNLYFETQNANLNNFVSGSLTKFYSPQITGYSKNWTAEESTVNIKKIADKTYSVDIKISTFDGYVYYTCPSVVFP